MIFDFNKPFRGRLQVHKTGYIRKELTFRFYFGTKDEGYDIKKEQMPFRVGFEISFMLPIHFEFYE